MEISSVNLEAEAKANALIFLRRQFVMHRLMRLALRAGELNDMVVAEGFVETFRSSPSDLIKQIDMMFSENRIMLICGFAYQCDVDFEHCIAKEKFRPTSVMRIGHSAFIKAAKDYLGDPQSLIVTLHHIGVIK